MRYSKSLPGAGYTEQRLETVPRNNGNGATYELYNLASDPTESEDIAGSHAEQVQELAEALESWQRSVIDSLNGLDY